MLTKVKLLAGLGLLIGFLAFLALWQLEVKDHKADKAVAQTKINSLELLLESAKIESERLKKEAEDNEKRDRALSEKLSEISSNQKKSNQILRGFMDDDPAFEVCRDIELPIEYSRLRSRNKNRDTGKSGLPKDSPVSSTEVQPSVPGTK